MSQVVEQKILSRIYGNGRGWSSQGDFADLGARSAIDSALCRREREGVIRRVIRVSTTTPALRLCTRLPARNLSEAPRHEHRLEGGGLPAILEWR